MKKIFYRKYLYPESNLSYYLQWKILSNISTKDLIIKTGLNEYIKKNISNKNYYNERGIFRPNKLLSLNKIDKEVKKFKSVVQNSLLGI